MGRQLFDLLLCDTIKWCAQKSDIDTLKSDVGVWQSCFDEYGYKVLDSIYGEFKYITLYTNLEASARACADRLYAQTGLSVKVSCNVLELNRCDFVIMADEIENPVANENTVIIDESGMCRFRCKNTIEFSLPFGFNALMEYFGMCDQRCMEFLFDICDVNIAREDNINIALKNIGCKFKKVLYKPHKNIDKM